VSNVLLLRGLDYFTLESRQVTLMIWALKGRLDALGQDVESRAPDNRRGSEALIVLAGGEAEGVVKGAAASNDVGTTGERVAGVAAAVVKGEAANNPNDTDSAPPQGTTEKEITCVLVHFRILFHGTESSVCQPIN
jgi:hypothetical protein